MADSDTDDVWQRDEIDSPCIRVCVLHPDAKLCMGCYRSSEEIAQWSRYSPEERQALMAELSSRAEAVDNVPRKRRGRQRRGAE